MICTHLNVNVGGNYITNAFQLGKPPTIISLMNAAELNQLLHDFSIVNFVHAD